MAHKLTFVNCIATLLRVPFMYQMSQLFFGGRTIKKHVFENYWTSHPGMKILDVGCGPAQDRDLLGNNVFWTGLETSEQYVRSVKKSLRPNDLILHGDVSALLDLNINNFDVVLLSGVLHHLNDDLAKNLLSDCSKVLVPNGKIFTIDPVRMPGASKLEVYLIDSDRGEFVRTNEEYDQLIPPAVSQKFTEVVQGIGFLPQSTRVAIISK
jgi:2-polyprenyl-3-methyl-5-hydroxy-6-metoxy-1,4-benzoquinol methylase